MAKTFHVCQLCGIKQRILVQYTDWISNSITNSRTKIENTFWGELGAPDGLYGEISSDHKISRYCPYKLVLHSVLTYSMYCDLFRTLYLACGCNSAPAALRHLCTPPASTPPPPRTLLLQKKNIFCYSKIESLPTYSICVKRDFLYVLFFWNFSRVSKCPRISKFLKRSSCCNLTDLINFQNLSDCKPAARKTAESCGLREYVK